MKGTFDGAALRLEREHNERAWLAWHVAALYRAKKMPKLERMLAKQTAARMRQSWQEQQAVMEMWAARMRHVSAEKKKKAR